MTLTSTRRVSRLSVPVSTTESLAPQPETGVPVFIGENKAHMARLVGVLVIYMDGRLDKTGTSTTLIPQSMAWGERVA